MAAPPACFANVCSLEAAALRLTESTVGCTCSVPTTTTAWLSTQRISTVALSKYNASA